MFLVTSDWVDGNLVLRDKDGAEIATVNGTTGTIQLPDDSSVNEFLLTLDIADGSADATYYLVSPYAGTIKKIYTVTDGAVGTADITVTGKIGSTAITDGAVTIATSGSAAGDVDSVTPSAENVITAGAAMNFVVAGGGSGGTPRIRVTVVLER